VTGNEQVQHDAPMYHFILSEGVLKMLRFVNVAIDFLSRVQTRLGKVTHYVKGK
jgi:hypothetical protein